MKNVILGVSGGIAAYKAADLASRLVKRAIGVDVIMTEAAIRFVGTATFRALTGRPVRVDVFDEEGEITHVELAQRADLFLVAPATANTIAKLAHGLADNLLTTVALAVDCPRLVAPAMNSRMYADPAVQANIATLRDRGYQILGPAAGRLACGEEGPGRMLEAAEIEDLVMNLLEASDGLKGVEVLVTAGPTREHLDPVRFLSNASSGKMGYALAREAARRGASVTLISGPTHLRPPYGVSFQRVTTTEEMFHAVMKRFSASRVVIKAAAPADFRCGETRREKIKKQGKELSLTLVPNPDILLELGRRKRPGQILVGFAAETGGVEEKARKKLRRKQLDMIVANDVSGPENPFGADTNTVTIITSDGRVESLPSMSKDEVARHIIDRVEGLLRSR